MAIWEADVELDMRWTFTVEAETEEKAEEELNKIIGYEGENLIDTPLDLQPWAEDFNIKLRKKSTGE